jgi:hypothetical protein
VTNPSFALAVALHSLGKEDFLCSPPFLSSLHFLVTYFSKRCASATKIVGQRDNVEN